MTIALCLNCGETKFGTLCPCNKCKCESTGNNDLDIAFSDHYVSAKVLNKYGEVIKMVNSMSGYNKNVKRWVFLKYISEKQSNVLTVKVPDGISNEVDDLYGKIEFPNIEWKPGMRNDPNRPTSKGCMGIVLLFAMIGSGMLSLVIFK